MQEKNEIDIKNLKKDLESKMKDLQTEKDTLRMRQEEVKENKDKVQENMSGSNIKMFKRIRKIKPPTFDGQAPWAVFKHQFETAAKHNRWNDRIDYGVARKSSQSTNNAGLSRLFKVSGDNGV